MWRSVPAKEGRLREFAQCDIDTRGCPSTLTDAEIVRALAEGLDALGVWRYRFLVNSRHALRGLLRFHGSTGERSGGFLWTLDRLNKVGAEAVTKELVDVHGLEEMSARLLVNDLTAQVTEPVRSRIAMGEQGRLGLD